MLYKASNHSAGTQSAIGDISSRNRKSLTRGANKMTMVISYQNKVVNRNMASSRFPCMDFSDIIRLQLKYLWQWEISALKYLR